jgi:excisionase family DNA binding protein
LSAARQYETLTDSATRLGVSTKTIRRRIAAGQLPAYRVGSLIRLDPAEVDAALLRPIPSRAGCRMSPNDERRPGQGGEPSNKAGEASSDGAHLVRQEHAPGALVVVVAPSGRRYLCQAPTGGGM